MDKGASKQMKMERERERERVALYKRCGGVCLWYSFQEGTGAPLISPMQFQFPLVFFPFEYLL